MLHQSNKFHLVGLGHLSFALDGETFCVCTHFLTFENKLAFLTWLELYDFGECHCFLGVAMPGLDVGVCGQLLSCIH